MKIFAISDLHLSGNCQKPMDIFGGNWSNYWQEILTDWDKKVSEDDIVLISGDISWAMSLEDASVDLNVLSALKGKKVILRGNHDYWWQSYTKVKKIAGENTFAIQNNCVRYNNLLVCGSRLWSINSNNSVEDNKILDREYLRLEMSLNDMAKMRKDGDYVVVMLHYPPFDATLRASKFTELITKYNIDCVVYGHLHGKDCRAVMATQYDNIQYYLTSCDKLNNQLLFIKEI